MYHTKLSDLESEVDFVLKTLIQSLDGHVLSH